MPAKTDKWRNAVDLHHIPGGDALVSTEARFAVSG